MKLNRGDVCIFVTISVYVKSVGFFEVIRAMHYSARPNETVNKRNYIDKEHLPACICIIQVYNNSMGTIVLLNFQNSVS